MATARDLGSFLKPITNEMIGAEGKETELTSCTSPISMNRTSNTHAGKLPGNILSDAKKLGAELSTNTRYRIKLTPMLIAPRLWKARAYSNDRVSHAAQIISTTWH